MNYRIRTIFTLAGKTSRVSSHFIYIELSEIQSSRTSNEMIFQPMTYLELNAEVNP